MDETTLAEAMEELSAAEDFLDFFNVRYEQSVVHVNRLHILQRFHDYIAHNPPAADADETGVRAHYRSFLERAYNDFVTSNPVQEKVFAVFKKAAGEAFVSLDAIKR